MSIKATIAIGIMTRLTETPPAFIATSSYFSPKLPMVIMEAKRTAIGSAMGTNVAEAYMRSSAMTENSRPLPTKSSTYFQTNCMRSTSTERVKVSTSGPMKDLSMSLSSLFIFSYPLELTGKPSPNVVTIGENHECQEKNHTHCLRIGEELVGRFSAGDYLPEGE